MQLPKLPPLQAIAGRTWSAQLYKVQLKLGYSGSPYFSRLELLVYKAGDSTTERQRKRKIERTPPLSLGHNITACATALTIYTLYSVGHHDATSLDSHEQ